MNDKVAVIGLGKVGIPIVAQCLSKGMNVTGIDINNQTIENLNKGIINVDEPEAENIIKKALERKFFVASTKFEDISECDIVIVIIPLVIDDDKNIKYGPIENLTVTISKFVKTNSLVIYETTLPIGDTRRFSEMLRKEKNIYVAYSPERVYAGRILKDLATYPKILGGVDEQSSRKAEEFYKKLLDVKVLVAKNSETAEASKLFDMIYRDTNIALANEYAKFCQDTNIDVDEVIELANTNPFVNIHLPGIGVGGHCTPVYPYFLINKSKVTIPSFARKINERMPEFGVNILQKELNKIGKSISESSVLVLGLSFRPGVKEPAFSPSIKVIEELKNHNACVYLHDPMFSEKEIRNFCEYGNLNANYDAVILCTAHPEYLKIDFSDMKNKGLKIIIDGRNVLKKEKIKSLGLIYRGIGK
ncbi:MAG: nucleotide sugar dehydrogenase [Candidatus Aenigmarchaeota archaeon]|nr:nucleotide sugar dehydrogenase [Candidatus Aenigmarchaeota archaeon]